MNRPTVEQYLNFYWIGTTGTLYSLIRQKDIPAGIWIDRLEECPEELVGATTEEVAAILAHLRARHPNGI